MMQAIRTRAGSIIVKILFVLLIISFGFWGIYTRSSYFQDSSSAAVIATVGDQSIHADELQKALRAALDRMRAQYGSSIDAQQIKQLGIADTLLGQLVDRSLLSQEAARLRLEISDDVVRSAIYENPAFRTPEGEFNRALFNQVLAMNGLTEDELVAQLRGDIPRSDLVQALIAGVTGPKPIADVLYRYRGEKRVADVVAFPVAGITDVGQPSEADLDKFYDAHQDQFRAPELRGFTVLSMSVADVAKGIEIPEDRLRKEYEERKDELSVPEQRDVQQILAPSEDKAKEAEAALAAGKEWKDVATTIAGQSPDTIDLGMMKREDMPHDLADVAFELPLDKASEPIHSSLGWHILRVVKIEPGKTPSFDEAKQSIAATLAQEDATDRLEHLGGKVDDALAGGASLGDVAAKFGLNVTTVAMVDQSGRDPEGKPAALPLDESDVVKTAFETEANRTSRVAVTQDGSVYAVHVDKVAAPVLRPLAEVKNQAVAAWQAEQKRDRATQAAEALAAAVKPDAPLAKLAADQHLTVRTPAPFGRRTESGAGVSPALSAKLFSAKPGEVVTAVDPSGAFVAQLKEVQVPPPPADTAVSGLASELAGAIKQDITGELADALRNRFPVEINHDAVNRLF